MQQCKKQGISYCAVKTIAYLCTIKLVNDYEQMIKKKINPDMKFIPFIIITLFFISCGEVIQNKNDLKNTLKETFTLEPGQEKIFALDNESVPLNLCVRLVDKMQVDSIYYTFFNEYNKSLYFYDFKTSEFLYKIHLDTEGPNGVYPYRSGYHIASYDTIYFYSLKTNYIYTLDHEGHKYQTFNYMDTYYEKLKAMNFFEYRRNQIPPSVNVTTENPIYIIDDKMYLCGQITEEFGKVDSINHLVITTIDIKTNEIEFNAGYPESYRKGNWGEAFFREVFWCYNQTKEQFILSFPNDHYVYCYQVDFKTVSKVYAGSIYAGSIPSMSFPLAFSPPKGMRNAHYFENYYYRAIIYDKYRNVYYRIVEHPWKDYHANVNIMDWLKPVSIIIYDSDFNFLGEKMLDMDYHLAYMNFILAEDGLYLYKKTDNEDEIVYTQFVLTQK
jgi:hypothetical protein